MPLSIPHCAARAVAPGDESSGHCAAAAFGLRQRRDDTVGILREVDKFGIPFHGDAKLIEFFTHDPFVVVLAENEDERVGTDGFSGVAERHMGHPAPLGPEVCARASLAEFQRSIE